MTHPAGGGLKVAPSDVSVILRLNKDPLIKPISALKRNREKEIGTEQALHRIRATVRKRLRDHTESVAAANLTIIKPILKPLTQPRRDLRFLNRTDPINDL
jgi:hypothetical protein